MNASPINRANLLGLDCIGARGLWLCIAVAFGLISSGIAAASIELPPIFGDNMVLQQSARGRPTILWGWSRSRERVTVVFNGAAKPVAQTSSRLKSVPEGWFRWEVGFENLPQGEYTVQVTQEKSLFNLTNVLVGEIWVSCFERAENVRIRPELLDSTRRTLGDRVRFLVLETGSFRPGASGGKSSGWRTLTNMLDQVEVATWNFHFGRALINNSKGSIRSAGIVISQEIADNFKREELARIKQIQLPDYPCPSKSQEMDSGFGAPCDAMEQYAEDYKLSQLQISELISQSKRRQTIRDDPAPGESIPSRYFYLHSGNVTSLGLSIRGVVCKTR